MNYTFARKLLILTLALSGSFSILIAADAGSDTAKPKTKPPPPPHRFGREAALEDVKKMTVADGLQVELFACEPDLVNPCDLDVDERGRVWISEGANYRSTFQKWGILRPEGDRIVILEDTNGEMGR